MLIIVGGNEIQVPDASSIQELLQAKDLSGDGIIVSVNDNVIRREFWKMTKLNPDDNVEIISMVFGG